VSIKNPERLTNVHPKLIALLAEVAAYVDIQIIEGERSLAAEQANIDKGASKLTDPKNCLHVVQADGFVHAVDYARYPVDWKDTNGFYFLGGFVCGMAKARGIHVRFGGDWNGDLNIHDQSFNDLDHIELPLV
jgi:peptidoglycan L-alanyl-D-glutamate endopeptidase CwlK